MFKQETSISHDLFSLLFEGHLIKNIVGFSMQLYLPVLLAQIYSRAWQLKGLNNTSDRRVLVPTSARAHVYIRYIVFCILTR
jgi:hypothetical protein